MNHHRFTKLQIIVAFWMTIRKTILLMLLTSICLLTVQVPSQPTWKTLNYFHTPLAPLCLKQTLYCLYLATKQGLNIVYVIIKSHLVGSWLREKKVEKFQLSTRFNCFNLNRIRASLCSAGCRVWLCVLYRIYCFLNAWLSKIVGKKFHT